MKFIALRPFRNVPGLELTIADALHENHVHKGAIFDFGKGEKLADIKSKEDLETIALLNYSACIGDAADTKLVARINKEVAAEKKSEEDAKNSAMLAGSNPDLIKKLVEALKNLQLKPA